MKNIRIIKENIDVSGIIKQLNQYPNDWLKMTKMASTQFTSKKIHTLLQLIVGGVSKPGELSGDTEVCMPTAALQRHTEIQKFLTEQKFMNTVCRCAFLKTSPGNITEKHIDEGKYYLTKDRYHLSITGTYRYSVWDNGDLEFTKEEAIIEPGTFFWFNNKKNHMAEVLGNEERITFIFDVPMSPNNP